MAVAEKPDTGTGIDLHWIAFFAFCRLSPLVRSREEAMRLDVTWEETLPDAIILAAALLNFRVVGATWKPVWDPAFVSVLLEADHWAIRCCQDRRHYSKRHVWFEEPREPHVEDRDALAWEKLEGVFDEWIKLPPEKRREQAVAAFLRADFATMTDEEVIDLFKRADE